MAQTEYSTTNPVGFAGQMVRDVPDGVRTALNEEATTLVYGIGVKQGAVERGVAKLAAVADKVIGVLAHKFRAVEDGGETGLPADRDGPLMQDGDIFVLCEEAIALGDRVFCRAIVAGEEVAGAFRNDADGTAQVSTVTPTAANSTQYSLNVSVYGSDGNVKCSAAFKITSDGDGTATEICDAFRTEMQAHTLFNSLVASTGTATLILTAVDKSNTFEVNDSGSVGTLSIAATTAGAPDCLELTNARWVSASSTGADGNTVACLRLSKV